MQMQPVRANLAQQMKKMQAAQGRWETQVSGDLFRPFLLFEVDVNCCSLHVCQEIC